eukprot:CAMPEP_0172544896 /NCGR_PEP_ID=MMETSP1067-20121228/14955_1 /TAXON_ID=265564 ORGANISM="Thalassiosira punctigera, Strain Tpunct2005C2" /NCGR_SAMPLE_ID=MMETSP1067 /ASSEMBLY_ACC=CAM_ASM_000444 /LENGTH=487 /DNA_ID=CAMNT_0013331547 /DNA_START=379 /DNA_END=1843 /DNA_ORIENTATION=+
MVRASTQQTVDRIVGTAVVIGLSVVFVRWLSGTSSSSDLMLEGEKCKKTRKVYRMPWWWPVIALKRWNGRSRKNEGDGNHDLRIRNEGVCKEDKEEIIENNLGDYEHQGSCHCSSVTFVLRGPQRLQAVDSPGKIRYPHIPTPANRFQLLRGESEMRFYYEEDNDDSSSITFDHAVEERNDTKDASGAHVFCGNCGVHVFHADRSSGELEVNANCLDGGETTLVFRERSSVGPSSITLKQPVRRTSPSRSQTSLPSAFEVDNSNDAEKLTRNSTIETVSETEPFLGSAYFLESLDDRKPSFPRKGSVTSDPTQPESHSTTMMAEGDDSSMGSSSVTGASTLLYHSSLSLSSGCAAPTRDRMDRLGLPPLPPRISSSDQLPPSRMSSSERSVKTLPPRFGNRAGYAPGGGSVGGGWSVASMESNDLDGANVGKTTISPRMRDQMKKYMQKYTNNPEGGHYHHMRSDVRRPKLHGSRATLLEDVEHTRA